MRKPPYLSLVGAVLCVLGIASANADDSRSASPRELEFARQATFDARKAWESGTTDSLVKLVQSMKALSCLRNEEFVCENLKLFESAGPVVLREGKTILLGRLSLGTALRERHFGVCYLENIGEKATGTCFRISAESNQEFRDTNTALAQQDAGSIDESLTTVRFLLAQFNKMPQYGLVQSETGTAVSGPPDKRGRPFIPTLLRQSGNTLFAVSLELIGRPGSFDDYPTLMLSRLKVLK